ncbi:NAD(P)-dependent dehydrogenase (short-subunit alcohol dehydrogenase family) [Variovorax boronicumulans]|uniref:NAD(P)-dependent dehydrogenase (Short-subunit alcohol dehydrogenase family) n=1 Tax=Variovorax boronicumulans TaxID=436515 RepID=A0AAW8DUB7_9BURK|nr:SDR family NAD(P)-dependent oxidoreductase [Variovorax boronicumulans]MDP9877659.1 NAD(P)-dependent dehydrogenase (short-subunit alcohol dehydrogenase family) [Variovorax boronicumulans]MDP9922944.1 NAD(P)-dependent dehydrogenase (short-subunit alcohol dehydrogenase family) [Variovorax boronicumulans]
MELNASVSAVITGGASGLGAATARALASHGVKVALFDLNAEMGETLAKEIGGVFCRVDVCSEGDVEAGFAKARAAHGQERILVNCAGISSPGKTAGRSKEDPSVIKPYSMANFERVLQTNLVGTFRCIVSSAAGMLTLDTREADRGVVISTASIAAEDGQMGQVAYTASKAGIVGMTLPIARDFSSEGIRVNVILPGLFNTPLVARARDVVKNALSASVPYPKRMGEPEEFASLAIEMCRNSYFNAATVRLDGALRMAPN